MVIAILRYILIFAVFLILSGCAKDTVDPYVRAHLEKPDWISGDSDKYSSSLFLIGRSVSADLNRAKRQSANDLASNIDQQIAASLVQHKVTQNEIQKQQFHNHEHTQLEVDKLLDQNSRNLLLNHIRISEVWQDPATKAYHVLTTVDRVNVGDELLNEVYHLDEQIDRIMKKADEEKDVLQRIAFANLAIEKQTQREKLQAAVKVVKPIASIAQTSWNREKIKNRISSWMNEIKILPIAQHKAFNLLGAMKDGVTSAGMTVHFGARPDYILKETFSQEQVRWEDGVYRVAGTLQIELLDGEWKGQVRGDASWPIEVSALEREQIPGELAEAIKQAHEMKLRSTLLKIEE